MEPAIRSAASFSPISPGSSRAAIDGQRAGCPQRRDIGGGEGAAFLERARAKLDVMGENRAFGVSASGVSPNFMPHRAL